MFVQFIHTKEIDIPQPPRGYVWRGLTSGDTDTIGLSGGPTIMVGCVSVTPNSVSAATFGDGYAYTPIGTFATPREAALALFAALGLEVQP